METWNVSKRQQLNKGSENCIQPTKGLTLPTSRYTNDPKEIKSAHRFKVPDFRQAAKYCGLNMFCYISTLTLNIYPMLNKQTNNRSHSKTQSESDVKMNNLRN